MEATQTVSATAPERAAFGALVVERGPLSFQTVTRTRRRVHVASCNFDVPAENYEDGWLTGIAAAAELMDALRRGEQIDVLAVIKDAAAHVSERGGLSAAPSGHGAAVGFLRMLEDVIGWVSALDHGAYFTEYADGLRKTKAERAARAAAAKVAFVQRMRAAREAKKARGGNHG